MVVFRWNKFHKFLYGRKCIPVTDHKPLIALINPEKGTTAMGAKHLARWVLMLNQYEYAIEKRKTMDHGNADTLSRLPARDDPLFDKEEVRVRDRCF